jgi:hypothetical protein
VNIASVLTSLMFPAVMFPAEGHDRYKCSVNTSETCFQEHRTMDVSISEEHRVRVPPPTHTETRTAALEFAE